MGLQQRSSGLGPAPRENPVLFTTLMHTLIHSFHKYLRSPLEVSVAVVCLIPLLSPLAPLRFLSSSFFPTGLLKEGPPVLFLITPLMPHTPLGLLPLPQIYLSLCQ